MAKPRPFDRAKAVESYDQSQQAYDAALRHKIVHENRIDLLMTRVLGYEMRPYTWRFLQHRFKHRKRSMVLAFRGAGKTWSLTIAYAIWHLVKDPNKRVLIVSRQAGNAEKIASLIRRHFEMNETFIRIFGDFRGDQWDKRSFWIKPRTSIKPEASIATASEEGAVVSAHYDVILVDDLVDLTNARTPGMRENTEKFFYTSLLPCLEPWGELHVVGTRYHHSDLYGKLQDEAGDMYGHTLIVPLLTPVPDAPDDAPEVEKWKSTWERDFSVEEYLRYRKRRLIDFETQYQCRTDIMVGEMFDYSKMDVRPLSEFPDHLPRFQGLDLAIALDKPNDYYAQVVVDYDQKEDHIWVRAVRRTRGIPTFEQRRRFYEWYDHYECQRAANESNFYQEAFTQEVKRERPDVRIIDVQSRIGKVERAWEIVDRIADSKITFADNLSELFDEMVQFPTGEHDDMVDGLGAAIKAAVRKVMKPRTELSLDWSTRLDKGSVSP